MLGIFIGFDALTPLPMSSNPQQRYLPQSWAAIIGRVEAGTLMKSCRIPTNSPASKYYPFWVAVEKKEHPTWLVGISQNHDETTTFFAGFINFIPLPSFAKSSRFHLNWFVIFTHENFWTALVESLFWTFLGVLWGIWKAISSVSVQRCADSLLAGTATMPLFHIMFEKGWRMQILNLHKSS